jgi:hypothetical protein
MESPFSIYFEVILIHLGNTNSPVTLGLWDLEPEHYLFQSNPTDGMYTQSSVAAAIFVWRRSFTVILPTLPTGTISQGTRAFVQASTISRMGYIPPSVLAVLTEYWGDNQLQTAFCRKSANTG